jgi:putative N-acetylmannosamine-6-phosphate epimerase
MIWCLWGFSGVAYVRFTSGDACDKYCEKYQNGLALRHKGRSYTVLVDKCTGIDIISGTLQGYIDYGASRCVRAVGADGNWSMAALKKLAEGESRKGKVENITDVYRNGVSRAITHYLFD